MYVLAPPWYSIRHKTLAFVAECNVYIDEIPDQIPQDPRLLHEIQGALGDNQIEVQRSGRLTLTGHGKAFMWEEITRAPNHDSDIGR